MYEKKAPLTGAGSSAGPQAVAVVANATEAAHRVLAVPVSARVVELPTLVDVWSMRTWISYTPFVTLRLCEWQYEWQNSAAMRRVRQKSARCRKIT